MIKMKMEKSWIALIAMALGLTVASAHAADAKSGKTDKPYTWKNGSVTVYSDTPNKLQLDNANVLNIRTKSTASVASAVNVPKSLAEQQAELNQKMADENKKIEEYNNKIQEEAKKKKEDNCRIARENRQRAENAQQNKEDLINRFDGDIQRFCN